MTDHANFEELFSEYKEEILGHRYITNSHIEALLNDLKTNFTINTIGHSVNKLPIRSVKIGSGPKKILMWSQMHGNESTTTKTLFDIFNTLKDGNNAHIMDSCSILVIPILNPDGAKAYTRLNANNIDLNRDAQNLSQPESKILRQVFDEFEPDFCFNLHGQRTIFSVGYANNSATVSFLAPAQDKKCTITPNRKRAMELIVSMNSELQKYIPEQVGIYDDAFNINCVGDTFQSHNVPTILFEAGHFNNDYAREEVRKYIYTAMLTALIHISNDRHQNGNYHSYLSIPENKKLFYDIIIRNAKVKINNNDQISDIAIQYDEILARNEIKFVPKVDKISNLGKYFGHKEIDACNHEVLGEYGKQLYVGYENDFVLINNELFSLKPVNN